MQCECAVSYTHLDVYKRQAESEAEKSETNNISGPCSPESISNTEIVFILYDMNVFKYDHLFGVQLLHFN